jgi:hypothetical protein
MGDITNPLFPSRSCEMNIRMRQLSITVFFLLQVSSYRRKHFTNNIGVRVILIIVAVVVVLALIVVGFLARVSLVFWSRPLTLWDVRNSGIPVRTFSAIFATCPCMIVAEAL